MYVGAGTSGGLAALDAQECETTFSTPAGQVVALMAADPAAEDDRDGGAIHRSAGISAADAVVGITASGRTPYVVGALQAAFDAGALTIALVCVPDSELAEVAEHAIAVVVGPEFIAGSTRLKAGTAQKLVLNTISTVAMIRLGKTFGNLMVDVAAANEKLRARGTPHRPDRDPRVERRRRRGPRGPVGEAKVAIVSLLAEVDADTARARLRETQTATCDWRSPHEARRRSGRRRRDPRPRRRRARRRADRAGRARERNGRGVAAPGFVDLQVNGFGGIDFLDSDAAGYRRAGEALETGVTAYLPTFITTPEEQLLAAIDEVPMNGEGPRILGIHLEAPSSRPDVSARILPWRAGIPIRSCSSGCSNRAGSDC